MIQQQNLPAQVEAVQHATQIFPTINAANKAFK